jgi:WD40 repeat protein
VAIAPDGSWLASGGANGTVRVWDASSGRERLRLEGHSDWIRSVAIAPDGTWLASGGDDMTVRVWDASSGRERLRLEGHSNWIRTLAIAPDGMWLASGGNDGTVRVWDAASGRERLRLHANGGSISSVAISSDGKSLAFAGILFSRYLIPAVSEEQSALLPLWSTRMVPTGGSVTLYPDDTHAGDADALEWLEYLEIEDSPTAPDGDIFPTIHRASDVAWLRRESPAAIIVPSSVSSGRRGKR